MLIKKKPTDDTKIVFPQMGTKPAAKKPAIKSPAAAPTKKTGKTKKHTTNFYAKQAATVLAKGAK